MLKSKHFKFGALIVFLVSVSIFYFTFVFQEWQGIKQHVVSDVPVHAKFVINFAAEHNFPSYTIWYRLVYILSGFSQNYTYIAYTIIVLLSALVMLKYWITSSILNADGTGRKNITLVSAGLIFVMPVISYYSCRGEGVNSAFCINGAHVYLGNISPNQWHNSTLILAMPFNILLFYFAVKNIRSEKITPYILMALLSVVSIICKPNYALAFLPVFFAINAFIKIKKQQYVRGIIQTAIVIIPSITILVVQWYFTYIESDIYKVGAKTIIAPFLVWSNYTPHIALSLLLSILFPLYILIFLYKKFDLYLIASWLVFLVAILTASIFAEMPNWGAGNYFWGAIASSYILFVFSARVLLREPDGWRARFGYRIFALHFASGFFMILSFFTRQSSLML